MAAASHFAEVAIGVAVARGVVLTAVICGLVGKVIGVAVSMRSGTLTRAVSLDCLVTIGNCHSGC
jgi:hypothetical protein